MRTILCCVAIAWLAAPASADPMLPKAGEQLSLQGGADWPGLTWLYDSPSGTDAAGKVVIHWFCAQRIKTCATDLARLITLRDTGHVYIVAYINGPIADAKKLDPIRESEGVGHGTVATGPAVKKLFKTLGIAKGPVSIVVDLDGKVKLVTSSGDINELDSRDTIVKSLVDAIKPFTTSNDAPKTAKANQKMTFTFKVQLGSWLTFSKKSPTEFTFQAAKEVKCDATTLKGDQLKVDGKTMTAQVTCTAPKGSYQARAEIRFGYDSPNGATGLGNDGATWKFEVTQ